GESDNGTSARIFATFLTWMQEKDAPVFVMATANDISRLPPEMLRKGRFDEVFFVDLPTSREREAILRLHWEKRLRDPGVRGDFSIDGSLPALVAMTEGYSGAELENVVISGLFEAFSESRALRMADLERAARNTVPLSVTQAEKVMELRVWAASRAVSASARDDRDGYGETPAAASAEKPTPETMNETRGGRTVDF
ncbi:MAG: AAA family ATPase, partial [Planctomycetes bacterium]|nr:AAA family ATPase [Planctomycetota bacterium]